MRLLLPLLVTLAIVAVSNGQQGLRASQMIDLQRQLETGLKARLPSEFDYLEAIVNQVRNRELPQSLVRSTFAWARKKPRYPIRYFDQALRLRAGRVGIRNVAVLPVVVQ